MPNVAIIGGGPSGLMAADVISVAGIGVTVYDRMPTVGRKFLMAGRGGLNLTHSEPLDVFLTRYGAARPWLEPHLQAFAPERVVAWAHDLGQETFVGSSGRVFPKAMKASPLLRTWMARLVSRGVVFATAHRWTGFEGPGRLRFESREGPILAEASATVLALGGASWPRLGSDGGWLDSLAGQGVVIQPLAPANCGARIAWSGRFTARHVGTPLKRIALTVAGRRVRGEAVISASGLEGGAVYALTPDIRRLLDSGARVSLEIDLRPDDSLAAVTDRLSRARGKQSMSTFLARAIDLAPAGRSLLFEAAGRTLPTAPDALARLIKGVTVTIDGLAGLDRAISTAGGVAASEIDSAMMLHRMPGVFVAGEMLDWEGPTGGYLLQGAFATGFAAGHGVLRHIGR